MLGGGKGAAKGGEEERARKREGKNGGENPRNKFLQGCGLECKNLRPPMNVTF